MNFGIAKSVKSREVKVCTPDLLDKALDSPVVARICDEIADALERVRGGLMGREDFETLKQQLKQQLPILTPHATFRDGQRRNAEAIASGLSMYDIDHIPHPRGRWAEIAPRAAELGIVLAHVTPSGEGLRIVFVIPQGMNLPQAQRWLADELGDTTYDAVCKDLARCSFLVPREYVLYLDSTRLFGMATSYELQATSDGDSVTSDELQTTSRGGISSALTARNASADDIQGATYCAPTPDVSQATAAQNVNMESQTAPASANPYPDTYRDIPYTEIVAALEEQLGGRPARGGRNNFVFAMACHLRYICNDDPRWLEQVVPTYGEEREKWQGTLRSALTRAQSREMTAALKRALKVCRDRRAAADGNAEEEEDGEAESLPPQMPDRLPPLIRLLTSRTPDVYKPAVAHAVFPALAAHLWRTRFTYIDNVEHEATLMNVLMAGTGAGKNCISEPINRIMADIRRRDTENLRREREWKDEVNAKGANKDKRKRPEGLVIQEVDPDMTNPAFVMRMAEADGHFLYTNMNELDQFDALRGSGRGNQQFQIMCLAFDPNNRYGQTRVGTQSITEKVQIRFNWNASTTIGKGQRYFRNVLTDGPISRINFCTIPEREIGAEMPVYGTYDAAFDEELRPYIERLTQAQGLVECPGALRLARKLKEECADFARLSQSRTYENLSFRANVIAYLKACVLCVAQDGRWDKVTEEFVRWSLQYDLWCKMRFFGTAIEEAERQGQNGLEEARKRGPKNLLTLLPTTFTLQDVIAVRIQAGLPERGSMHMVRTWKSRGYVSQITDHSFEKCS